MTARFGFPGAAYFVAVFATLLVLAVRLFLLEDILGSDESLSLFILAVLLAAGLGGWWPGVVATALGALVGGILVLQPRYGFSPSDPDDWVRLTVFVTLGLSTSWLCEMLHRYRQRTERHMLERSRTAIELARSRRLFERIAETTPDLLYVYDFEQQRNVFCNREIVEVLGYSADMLRELGDGLQGELIHPDDRGPSVQHRARLDALHDGQVLDHAFRVRHADGTYRWLRCREVVFERSSGGRVKQILGVARDVTDQLRVERELRESDARFRLTLDAADLGSWDWDLVTGELRWDARCKAVFGIAEEADVSFERFLASVFPEDRERVESGVRKTLAEHTDYHAEFRTVWPDGSIRWVLGKGRGFFDSTGRPLHMSGIVLDITARKQLEAELERHVENMREAERHKDEFLALLAHELRNPLAPIRNAVQLLKLQPAPSADLASICGIIDRQASQLARLVDDLLDVSRIARGKVVLRKERLALSAVVQSAVEAARPNLDAMQHEFSVSLPPERIELEGDASRLAQVLSNLLNNACKFTEPGGRIALAAQREGDQVAIRVRDSGIGIRSEVLPRVFDMFVQGDASVARSQSGLGLGLPLAKGLVEMHGGSVTATSGGPGQGAEFVVRLPIAPPRLEDVHRPPETAPEVQALRLKILVVDDNRDAATSLASLLKLRGHEVVAVHDGPAALDAADRFSPEVVLQDIGMPGMSGFEVARQLRQRASGRDLTLVALTGYGSDDDRRRTREAGFDSHFVKPLDLAALDDLLARREATATAAPGR